MNTHSNSILSQEAALEKIKNWCAYQERCQLETLTKLQELGLAPVADEIIAHLIAENFLNEERYAHSYASGKFRIKKWGKLKIRHALRLKKISLYSIQKALESLADNEYRSCLKKLLDAKAVTIKESNPVKKKYKLLQFAYSKGFEQELVMELLDDKSQA